MDLKHIPNLITFVRIVLLLPFIFFIWQGQYVAGFYVFILAGLSDAVDGFLARYFGWLSWTGALVDPLADKLLMITSFILLAAVGQLPWVIVYLFVMRDVVIVAGAATYYYLFRDIEFQPTGLSKVNTFLQIALATLLLHQLAYESLASWFTSLTVWITLAVTLLSLLQYMWVWSLKARRQWVNRLEKHG
ncbi:MAG: CDP-alcohol phosphatidyltransferase family protein [Legionellales bacterium]|nr:CDP-alcohol phosphatidyltransferase family protein [Legionellales bacterium]